MIRSIYKWSSKLQPGIMQRSPINTLVRFIVTWQYQKRFRTFWFWLIFLIHFSSRLVQHKDSFHNFLIKTDRCSILCAFSYLTPKKFRNKTKTSSIFLPICGSAPPPSPPCVILGLELPPSDHLVKTSLRPPLDRPLAIPPSLTYAAAAAINVVAGRCRSRVRCRPRTYAAPPTRRTSAAIPNAHRRLLQRVTATGS